MGWYNFQDKWMADPVTVGGVTMNPWTKDGCDDNTVHVGKALYSSMICQMAANSDAEMSGGDASACENIPVAAGTYAGQTVTYTSKASQANVGLSVSDRYEQR